MSEHTISNLLDLVEKLRVENNNLRAEVERLRARVAHLEEQLLTALGERKSRPPSFCTAPQNDATSSDSSDGRALGDEPQPEKRDD